MPQQIPVDAPRSLHDVVLTPHGSLTPSPADWRDQFFYFLLPDRFSDNQESSRPLYNRNTADQFQTTNLDAWHRRGDEFVGGNLKGVSSKLDYLKSLGVTVIWLGPVLTQRPELQTYHGYGIQNFLDVDRRFGTRQDLRDLVDAAHNAGIYVILDVIYNHSGNNFFYSDDSGQPFETLPYRFSPPHPVNGWRSTAGTSLGEHPCVAIGDGVWPSEFQNPNWYTRAGSIGKWDAESWEDPMHPDNEFRRGDFMDLKDFDHTHGGVLSALTRVYEYWIGLCDLDGFRIDTVKHVSWEASKNFCGAIREYAESIGKENFLLLAEVAGGSALVRNYLDVFGRNIDAALDIGEPAECLASVVKGLRDPVGFFDQYRGHDILGSHRETGRYHVSVLDDHDRIGRERVRFSTGNTIANRHQQVAHAVGMMLTTLGMPCMYYGTEQAFAGWLDNEGRAPSSDRYIREAMFGGNFGAFCTEGCHFFDRQHPTYLRIAAIARVRSRRDSVGLALRRGRQYQREVRFLDTFAVPGRGEIAAWSRVLHSTEVVVALNTNGSNARGADVTIDGILNENRNSMLVLYRGDWTDSELMSPPVSSVPITRWPDGRLSVRVDLPAAGMVVLG